jgi:hypothetical protein
MKNDKNISIARDAEERREGVAGNCYCGLRPGQRPVLSCFRRFDTYTCLPKLTLSPDVRAEALTVGRRRCREVVVGL